MADVKKIGRVEVIIDHDEQTVTSVWPDSTKLVAKPSYDQESMARAEELGYGVGEDAVWAMTQDHDRLHHAIAAAQGDPWSLHLRRIALGKPLTAAERDAGHREECLVFLLTRALNGIAISTAPMIYKT